MIIKQNQLLFFSCYEQTPNDRIHEDDPASRKRVRVDEGVLRLEKRQDQVFHSLKEGDDDRNRALNRKKQSSRTAFRSNGRVMRTTICSFEVEILVSVDTQPIRRCPFLRDRGRFGIRSMPPILLRLLHCPDDS